MNEREHWEKIYLTTPSEKLGWYAPHLETSLTWIRELCLPKDVHLMDVGGGTSALVNDLISEGYRLITVLDISKNALSSARERLGDKALSVTWLEGNITTVDLPANHYDLWHDRAVFHFLTSPEQQQQYRGNLLTALRPGGHLIIGTFAPEAPPKCSGLPVQRYTLDELQTTLGPQFELSRHEKVLHITPRGVEQMYLYCHFRRSA